MKSQDLYKTVLTLRKSIKLSPIWIKFDNFAANFAGRHIPDNLKRAQGVLKYVDKYYR